MSQSASALQRVAVSLSRGERDALRELATRRSEPEATTAARLIRAGLADVFPGYPRADARPPSWRLVV